MYAMNSSTSHLHGVRLNLITRDGSRAQMASPLGASRPAAARAPPLSKPQTGYRSK